MLLLLCASVLGIYLFGSGKLDDVMQAGDLVSTDPMDYIELEAIEAPEPARGKVVKEAAVVRAEERPKRKPSKKIASERKLAGKRSERYYLKLGDCMFGSCVRELADMLRRMKQPVYKKKLTGTTQYFEVVSVSSYDKDRAKEKVLLLQRYAKPVGMPYLIDGRSRYWISYGQYPDRMNAVTTVSYLRQFSFDTMMSFHLVPRVSRYEMTRIFAGPYFRRGSAENLKRKLERRSRYRRMTVTAAP